MREPYQMDLLDLEDRAYQPVPSGNPLASATMYYCPKCRDFVGMYSKEGKDKGWHYVKEECSNGHRLNWEAVMK